MVAMRLQPLMASFLDPRMKGGVGISDTNREIIYDNIRDSIIEIATADLGHLHLQPTEQQQLAEEDDIFDEINNHYIDQNVNRGDAAKNPDAIENAATIADAELTLYKQEPMIKLRKDDGTFNCPLTWWKCNEHKYKLLSILAARLLCIPAASATSECVFSVAVLTIAKDRARLASDTANKLIFLHDALPGIREYFEQLHN
jgi:hypothetical protein